MSVSNEFLKLEVDLRRAIESGDTTGVEEILHSNPKLFKEVNNKLVGSKLLRRSIVLERDVITELLIRYGVDVNLEISLGLALYVGTLRSVELLLKNGAKLDGPEWNKYPLDDFGEDDPDEEMSALAVLFPVGSLHRKLARNIKNRKRKLELLFQNGLSPDHCSSRGENIMYRFIQQVRKNDDDVVETAQAILDAGVPMNYPETFQVKVLYHSVFTKNPRLVKFFIDKGEDVNEKIYAWGSFPLYVSVFNVDVVKLLILSGAKIDTATTTGKETALHEACYCHRVESVSLLIECGADIGAENFIGRTPLSCLLRDSDILNDDEYYLKCLKVVLKEFARLSFANLPVSKKDMDMINAKPLVRDIFLKHVNELHLMAITKFYSPYSYYRVIQMGKKLKKLSKLTKNEEFMENYADKLPSLSYYKEDLQKIMDKAVALKDDDEIVEARLKSAFKDIFPDTVIRTLTEQLEPKDLPL